MQIVQTSKLLVITIGTLLMPSTNQKDYPQQLIIKKVAGKIY